LEVQLFEERREGEGWVGRKEAVLSRASERHAQVSISSIISFFFFFSPTPTGGGILVPLFMLLLDFSPRRAIPLSNVTILVRREGGREGGREGLKENQRRKEGKNALLKHLGIHIYLRIYHVPFF